MAVFVGKVSEGARSSGRSTSADEKKRSERRKHCARAGCSKVRTPPARHKHTDRTDYNTLCRYLARSVKIGHLVSYLEIQ